MKKKIMIALGAVLVVIIAIIAVIKLNGFGSRPDATVDTMELSEVSGLVTEKGYVESVRIGYSFYTVMGDYEPISIQE